MMATSSAQRPAAAASGSVPASEMAQHGASPDSIKKLDQIIQNFYAKTAALVLKSRTKLQPLVAAGQGKTKPEIKTNKWFQIETEEFLDFREVLSLWKSCGGFERRPPPMVIELYLDTSLLKTGQCLVLVDDHGKKWNVTNALNTFYSPTDDSATLKKRRSEILIERWQVELRTGSFCVGEDFGPILPTLYKKCMVFFRALFTTIISLPSHKIAKQSIAKVVPPTLEVKCRVSTRSTEYRGFDPLRHALYEPMREKVVTDLVFEELELPAGRLYSSVTYRNNCNFCVEDSESLLSSQLAMDDYVFEPSVPRRRSSFSPLSRSSSPSRSSLPEVPGSAEVEKSDRTVNIVQAGPFSSRSSLQTTRNSDLLPEVEDRLSPARASPSQKSGIDVGEGVSGRPVPKLSQEKSSIFKAGSVSESSPLSRAMDGEAGSLPPSISKLGAPVLPVHARRPSSLTQGMPSSLRGPQASNLSSETLPTATSPRPNGPFRYNSSSGNATHHHRARTSFSGTARTSLDDDRSSSGRQSLTSSAAIAVHSAAGSDPDKSGTTFSFQKDQEDLEDFMKTLDSYKSMPVFDGSVKTDSDSSVGRGTTLSLSKLKTMRDTHQALSDSITSSFHSRQRRPAHHPSTRPATAAGSSATVSSGHSLLVGSPGSASGKAVLTHGLHTPVVPSRLSMNAVADYGSSSRRHVRDLPGSLPEASSRFAGGFSRMSGTPRAIDIPSCAARGGSSHANRAVSGGGGGRGSLDTAFTDYLYWPTDERDPRGLSNDSHIDSDNYFRIKSQSFRQQPGPKHRFSSLNTAASSVRPLDEMPLADNRLSASPRRRHYIGIGREPTQSIVQSHVAEEVKAATPSTSSPPESASLETRYSNNLASRSNAMSDNVNRLVDETDSPFFHMSGIERARRGLDRRRVDDR